MVIIIMVTKWHIVLTLPFPLKLRAAMPRSCPPCSIDTVSMVTQSHTQMKGAFPVCAVATTCLSGCSAKLEKITSAYYKYSMYRIAGYIGRNYVWWIARKMHLADINVAVTVQSPRLLWESTLLAQYIGGFNIGGVTRNLSIRQI